MEMSLDMDEVFSFMFQSSDMDEVFLFHVSILAMMVLKPQREYFSLLHSL
jgi:hypothetical protein